MKKTRYGSIEWVCDRTYNHVNDKDLPYEHVPYLVKVRDTLYGEKEEICPRCFRQEVLGEALLLE